MAVGVISVLWFAHRAGLGLVDDAYIGYRYAQNFAARQGLCFNPPERVEGYSNTLWVLAISIWAMVGAPPHVMGPILQSAALLGLLGVTYALARTVTRTEGAWTALAAVIITFGHPGLTFYALAGMETVSHVLLVALAALLSMHARKVAGDVVTGVVLVLVSLSRPEGIMVAPVILVGRLTRTRSRPVAATAIVAVVVIVGWGAFLLWRKWYFGDWVPNTFHAKTLPLALPVLVRGGAYVLEFLLASLTLVFAVPWTVWCMRSDRQWSVMVIGLLGLHIAFALRFGGDWMPMSRFLLPVWPMVAVCIAQVIARWVRPGKARNAADLPSDIGNNDVWSSSRKVLVVLSSILVALTVGGVSYRFEYKGAPDRTHAQYPVIGKWLAGTAAPGETLATTCMGAIPYYSGLRSYDILGLIEPHIARQADVDVNAPSGHAKADTLYVLARRPTYYIVWARLWPEPVSEEAFVKQLWFWKHFHRLYESEDFRREYAYTVREIAPGKYFAFYKLRPEAGAR